jgi:hypothetical protein
LTPSRREATSPAAASIRSWETTSNPLLAAPDEDTFTCRLLASLGSYSAYFDRIAEVNRRGPAPVTSAPLTPAALGSLAGGGGQVIDVPLGFVLADGQDPAEVARQALKIGYENLAGQLTARRGCLARARRPGRASRAAGYVLVYYAARRGPGGSLREHRRRVTRLATLSELCISYRYINSIHRHCGA